MDGFSFFLLCIVIPACLVLPLYASTLLGVKMLSILFMLVLVVINGASAVLVLVSEDWDIYVSRDLWTMSHMMMTFFAISGVIYALGLWLRDRGWKRNRVLLGIYPVYCLIIGAIVLDIDKQYARAEVKAMKNKIVGNVLNGTRTDLCPDGNDQSRSVDDQLRRIDCVVQLLEPGRLESTIVIDRLGIPRNPLADPRR